MAPYLQDNATVQADGHHRQLPSLSQNGFAASSPATSGNGQLSAPIHDLVCVGFGPASLAIAIALREKSQSTGVPHPKVSFLERQPQFAWHAGMLLPGSKMQISFIKDLATLRNPQSKFTFLNYLHQHGRLVQFSNLGTFLPSRIEFEDYMRWCAGQFEDCVEYSQEVLEVLPNTNGQPSASARGSIDSFVVKSRNLVTNQVESRIARNVVIAVGGKPKIPQEFPQPHPNIIHSSAYVKRVSHALPEREKPYRIAVIGNGQSAAEIFHDLGSRFPNAQTFMIIKDTALRPSDDSPFVNEVFNPERVDLFFDRPEKTRSHQLLSDKSTNYGVVRLELLEAIYGRLYQQRIRNPNEEEWQHRIFPSRLVYRVDYPEDDKSHFILHLRNADERPDKTPSSLLNENPSSYPPQTLDVDAVFVATGYVRNAHEEMLTSLLDLAAPQPSTAASARGPSKWTVQRNYSVALDPTKVDTAKAGIWLQGCNQDTHGLADTLLSILAIRGAEIVDSMFGAR